MQAIEVRFDELSLEYEPYCGYDSVTLYDGSNANSPELGAYCTAAPDSITSAGATVFVVFETDLTANDGRFLLSWSFVGQGGQGPPGGLICTVVILHCH